MIWNNLNKIQVDLRQIQCFNKEQKETLGKIKSNVKKFVEIVKSDVLFIKRNTTTEEKKEKGSYSQVIAESLNLKRKVDDTWKVKEKLRENNGNQDEIIMKKKVDEYILEKKFNGRKIWRRQKKIMLFFLIWKNQINQIQMTD